MSNLTRFDHIDTRKTIKLKTVGASMEDDFNGTQPRLKNLLAKLEVILAELRPSLFMIVFTDLERKFPKLINKHK